MAPGHEKCVVTRADASEDEQSCTDTMLDRNAAINASLETSFQEKR